MAGELTVAKMWVVPHEIDRSFDFKGDCLALDYLIQVHRSLL